MSIAGAMECVPVVCTGHVDDGVWSIRSSQSAGVKG